MGALLIRVLRNQLSLLDLSLNGERFRQTRNHLAFFIRQRATGLTATRLSVSSPADFVAFVQKSAGNSNAPPHLV